MEECACVAAAPGARVMLIQHARPTAAWKGTAADAPFPDALRRDLLAGKYDAVLSKHRQEQLEALPWWVLRRLGISNEAGGRVAADAVRTNKNFATVAAAMAAGELFTAAAKATAAGSSGAAAAGSSGAAAAGSSGAAAAGSSGAVGTTGRVPVRMEGMHQLVVDQPICLATALPLAKVVLAALHTQWRLIGPDEAAAVARKTIQAAQQEGLRHGCLVPVVVCGGPELIAGLLHWLLGMSGSTVTLPGVPGAASMLDVLKGGSTTVHFIGSHEPYMGPTWSELEQQEKEKEAAHKAGQKRGRTAAVAVAAAGQ